MKAAAARKTVAAPGIRKRGLSAGVAGLCLLGLTVGALGHVAIQAKRVEVGLELGKQQKKYREMVEEQRILRLQIERLKDPTRILEIARSTLKMGPPEPTALMGSLGGGASP